MESPGLSLIAFIAAMALTAPSSAAPLEPVASIIMPGVKGRIDHFAIDLKGRRLFVAALGNNTVEVLDIAGNKHLKSLPGFGEPQGIEYLAQTNRLYVANGSANRVDVLDGASLNALKRIGELDDADNVRYDAAAGMVIVGYGSGALRLMKADTAEAAGDIKLAGHPESFQLESGDSRIFVNVPTAQQVAVVDRVKKAVVATWPLSRAGKNFPMALDEKNKRLFVGARAPALVLAYDTETGQVVARLSVGGDADDLFYDTARQRLYAICGDGQVDVFRQETPDRYAREASIKTAPRARTGFFVPELNRLYVAAPANASSPAHVLVYRTQ